MHLKFFKNQTNGVIFNFGVEIVVLEIKIRIYFKITI